MNNRKSLIYVVDDNVSICRSLTLLLKSYGFKVETFTHARSFLAYKHPKLPSCLVLDIRLPDINGITLQDMMTRRGITIPIIFITGHGDIPMSVKGMKGGAIDFLPKPFAKKKLLNAIALAISKSTAQVKEQAEIAKIKRRIRTLSPRELEIFRLVAKGMMSKNIAVKLGTALQTIKVHRGRVMQKMRTKTVTELIHLGQKVGITSSILA
jgi:FixJ family two-component response regulator